MGEYNYSAPYRGTGAPLPEGYLNALMQPGRNIGAGLESAGNAVAEGIGKYYKNKEEKAGAQAAAEGAVAQYLGLNNPPQRQLGQQDEMVRDRYLGQVQDRQKDIINVVGEKTWQKFQDGKASTPEILGLTHSLQTYDRKVEEGKTRDLQYRQMRVSEGQLAASTELNKKIFEMQNASSIAATDLSGRQFGETVVNSAFNREQMGNQHSLNLRSMTLAEKNQELSSVKQAFEINASTEKNRNENSLFKLQYDLQNKQSSELIKGIDSNNTISNVIGSNPRKEGELQYDYYNRILRLPELSSVPWDIRAKMESFAFNSDKNMPHVVEQEGRKYLMFNGSMTEVDSKSKGRFVQAYTLTGEPMVNQFWDLDTKKIVQSNVVGNPLSAAIAAQVTGTEIGKGLSPDAQATRNIMGLFGGEGYNLPVRNTNATPVTGYSNLTNNADGSFNFTPKTPGGKTNK